jgi:hypothetical protein
VLLDDGTILKADKTMLSVHNTMPSVDDTMLSFDSPVFSEDNNTLLLCYQLISSMLSVLSTDCIVEWVDL